LQREYDKLERQLVELQQFDGKLRHYADRRITRDLDDGVKVNYGKFGSLLDQALAILADVAVLDLRETAPMSAKLRLEREQRDSDSGCWPQPPRTSSPSVCA
jgi:hypothetical protein